MPKNRRCLQKWIIPERVLVTEFIDFFTEMNNRIGAGSKVSDNPGKKPAHAAYTATGQLSLPGKA